METDRGGYFFLNSMVLLPQTINGSSTLNLSNIPIFLSITI